MGFASLLGSATRAVLGVLKDDSITYSPGIGSPRAVDGIFDAAYVLVAEDHAGVSSSGPAVFLQLADLPSDPRIDLAIRITVGSTVYKVREVRPDGVGGVVIALHEAA